MFTAWISVGLIHYSQHILQIESSRLVTSYPISPQSSFTCPPTSLRRKTTENKNVTRYTYASTHDSRNHITSYKDIVEPSGKTTSSVTTLSLPGKHPVVFLTTVSASSTSRPSAGAGSLAAAAPDIVLVRRNGSVLCLGGEELAQKWVVSAEVLSRDLSLEAEGKDLVVESVSVANESDVVGGMFKGREDVFAAMLPLGHKSAGSGELLVLITRSSSSDDTSRKPLRHLHLGVVGTNTLTQICACPLPPRPTDLQTTVPSYQLDAALGLLLELWQGELTTFDVSESVPKATGTMNLPDANSFLRIGSSSVLVSAPETIELYNPTYKSLQGSISYMTTQERLHFTDWLPGTRLALGIQGQDLMGIQLSGRGTKRRAVSSLIEAVGRGLPRSSLAISDEIVRGRRERQPIKMFSSFLPGSLSDSYLSRLLEDIERAKSLASTDEAAFEGFVAEKLGMAVKGGAKQPHKLLTNGLNGGVGHEMTNGVSNVLVLAEDSPDADWIWPDSPSEYPPVDRRWVMFAMQRAFTLDSASSSSSLISSSTAPYPLTLSLPSTSNIVAYLIDAGHLTAWNVVSALRINRSNVALTWSMPLHIPRALAQADATLGLLCSYVDCTPGLGARELCVSVWELMRSLELLPSAMNLAPVLTNGASEDDEDAELAVQQLERDMELAEHYYNASRGNEIDNDDVRARALSVALAKLGTLAGTGTPTAPGVVRAVREVFAGTEAKAEKSAVGGGDGAGGVRAVLALILVLRSELVRGGWTGDLLRAAPPDSGGRVPIGEDDDEGDASPADQDAGDDGGIAPLSDLLARCVDAIAPSGWLLNDSLFGTSRGAPSSNGDGDIAASDFLTDLMHEVSAALEGCEEAIALGAMLSEALRFAHATARAEKEIGRAISAAATRKGKGATDNERPVKVDLDESVVGGSNTMLPLGLKPRMHVVPTLRVAGGGGELVNRSVRQTGHIISKRVQDYSLEKIII